MEEKNANDGVGPILYKNELAKAVVQAIQDQNKNVTVIDRDAYIRVAVSKECRVSRLVIEKYTGEYFSIPRDLESIMSSFSGKIEITDEEIIWRTP